MIYFILSNIIEIYAIFESHHIYHIIEIILFNWFCLDKMNNKQQKKGTD